MRGFKFWGVATIGTKGQFVIPAEAREELGVAEGDKLLILSAPGSQGIMAMKQEVVEEFMQKATRNMRGLMKQMERHQ